MQVFHTRPSKISQLLADVQTVRGLYLNFRSEKVLTLIIFVLLSLFICSSSYLSGSFLSTLECIFLPGEWIHTHLLIITLFYMFQILVRPECCRVLVLVLTDLQIINLGNFHEECDFAWTMYFLEAAPCLEELCITVWDHKCCRESQKSFPRKWMGNRSHLLFISSTRS
jgi:hypothetical protein